MFCFFRNNGIKGGNLKGQAANDFRTQFVYSFKRFFLREDEKVTEELFIERLTHEYNDGKIKFMEFVPEMNEIYVRISDLNGDGKISIAEYRKQAEAMGLESFTDKYFNAYPQQEDGTIPNKDFLKSLIELYCNSDQNNVSPLEKAACLGVGMTINI